MESQHPEKFHTVAHTKVYLYQKMEGGVASIHGRLMTPAIFNDAKKSAWSSWFVFLTPTRIGTESLIPMAIVFEDEAPTDRLLTVGSTFTIFLDRKTYGEGDIVDVMIVPDDEFWTGPCFSDTRLVVQSKRGVECNEEVTAMNSRPKRSSWPTAAR